jgi:hypothetical protein
MFGVDLAKPTDELFIANILTHNNKTRHIFRGVFSLNEIVKKPTTLPAAYVYNTFPRKTKTVGHWICLYISKKNEAEFFGSFGLRPPRQLLTMVKIWGCTVTWNKIRFQNYNSNVCGLYVIYYLHFKCNGWTMKQIQQHFNGNNDKYVKKSIHSMVQSLK